ncbi:MAG TPA: hypothetical protein VJ890_24935 [Vineibacter sp.]|nr:hypothetical protein [Vineibacter sp.]
MKYLGGRFGGDGLTQWARGVVRTVGDYLPWSATWGTSTDERRQDNNDPQALETPQPSRLLLQSGDLLLRQNGYKLLLQDQRHDAAAFAGAAVDDAGAAADAADADDAAPYDFAIGLVAQDAVAVVEPPPAPWFDVANDDDPDDAPADWYAVAPSADEIGETLAAVIDGAADGDDDDPAPHDFIASLAADEHDVPAPGLWSGVPEDEPADDGAPLDFFTTIAVEDVIAAPDMPAGVADGDDAATNDNDEAAYDWTGGPGAALNEEAPVGPAVSEWYQRVRRRR